jgi:O-antigen/teichoic acid export membrane protein
LKVIKNFIWNAGYQIFILLIPLITIPYINRVLGPIGVGINAYTNSIVQYFVLFGSLGINIYGNREIAYTRDNKEAMSQKFWELSILRIITIGLAVITYLVFILINDKYRVFYLAQGFYLLGAAFDISWFFQGLENFKVTVLRNAFVKIVSLILVFSLVRNANDTAIYIVIMSGSQFLGFLTLWPYLKGLVKKPRIRINSMIQNIRPSITLLIPQIATQIYLQLNKTMLGSIQGVQAAGFFDNSDKIIKMLLAIVTATGTVLLPHVAHSFANGDKKAVIRSLEISMHVILVMAIPLCFGIASISVPFTHYFFSERFAPVANLMAVESIVVIFIGISNAIGVQYLLPTNQLKSYTTSVILGSIVNIVLNIPLIFAFGTIGAIVATVVSEAVVTAYQIFKVRKQLHVSRLFSETGKYVVASLIMFICVQLARRVLSSSILSLVIEVVFAIIVYVIVLVTSSPKVLYSYMKQFRSSK